MANNQYINKIIYGNNTLLDLSEDTVSANKVFVGESFHLPTGQRTIGTATSDATAAANDIISGETAYVNGSKITGTLVIQHYYTGSTAPSSSLGNDGDIYLQQD